MSVSEERAAAPGSAVVELLRHRASVRDFTDEPLDPSVLDTVLETALRAPTSFNFQSYALVAVVDEARRKTLAEIVRKDFVRRCAAFVLVCRDLSALPETSDAYGVPLDPRSADAALSATIDAAMAGLCLSLCADSLGLGSVMVGAVRNAPHEVAEVLGLPPDAVPLFGVCLGHPAERPAPRPRLRPDLVVHRERYRRAAAERAAPPSGAALSSPAGPVSDGDLFEWRAQVAKGLRVFGRRDGLT